MNATASAHSAVWSPSESPDISATVIEVGEGMPVVFLHGLVGLNEHWEGVVNRVKNDLRCILFQLPLLQMRGDDCSIQGVTRLTTQFLREHFSNESVILVGNSFGGHVALRIALAIGRLDPGTRGGPGATVVPQSAGGNGARRRRHTPDAGGERAPRSGARPGVGSATDRTTPGA